MRGERERRADAGYQETVPAQPASQVTARQTFGNKTIKAFYLVLGWYKHRKQRMCPLVAGGERRGVPLNNVEP
jgi:hypothetical protein